MLAVFKRNVADALHGACSSRGQRSRAGLGVLGNTQFPFSTDAACGAAQQGKQQAVKMVDGLRDIWRFRRFRVICCSLPATAVDRLVFAFILRLEGPECVFVSFFLLSATFSPHMFFILRKFHASVLLTAFFFVIFLYM